MKWSILYIFILIVTNPVEAQAQPVLKQSPWSLQQCFDYAKEHNIQINTERLNQQTAEQDIIAAQGARTPSLSGLIGNTFNNANNTTTVNGPLVNQLTNTGAYSLNSSVVLWNGGIINNTIQQQKLNEQNAGLIVRQSENNITIAITQAYLNILLAKENLVYISQLVSASDSSVTQGKLLYDAGSIAKAAYLQLQAQLATDKFTLIQVQNAIRQNTLSLKQLLQLPSEAYFDIASPGEVTIENNLHPLADVQQSALDNFPDSKISKVDVDIASLDIANARAAFKPVLKATGAIGSGYGYTLTNPVTPKEGYFTQTGDNFYQNIGLSLSIPIFTQRINKTNLAKANIAYKQAEFNLQNTQLVLTQAVEQAYISAQNAMESFNAADDQLKAATETYRIGMEEFKLGGINAYDLLQQRNQYVQAVQAYTQAKYAALLQQKLYEFYLNSQITL